MKFKAVATEAGDFTEGKTYYGQIALDYEINKSEAFLGIGPCVMVVIFADDGNWKPFSAHYFEPLKE